jgi:hypothetical protein
MANQYPVIAAGQRITTNLLNAMIPVVIRKPSSTARTSTTTLADDPDLTFQLAANSVYFVEFMIKYATPGASGTAGFKTGWTVPSGASGNRTSVGAGSAATDTGADNMATHTGVHGYATAETYGSRLTSTTNQLWLIETSTVNTSSAGTCAFQWAQQTSNASATTVFSDSIMRITQLA